MEIKDLNIFCKTLGRQLNFILLLGIWAVLLFIASVWLLDGVARWVLAGISLYIAAYFIGYALILTRRVVEKYYR